MILLIIVLLFVALSNSLDEIVQCYIDDYVDGNWGE